MKLATRRVLVIGGGVTGQRAALDLLAAGLEVVLVERAVTLGGTVAQLGTMFPLHNCLLCRGVAQHGPGCTRPTISAELLDFARSPHLSVRTQSELVTLTGKPGAFRATLRTEPRYVKPELCINCDRCAQVCPQSLPDEQQAGLTQRKAAYRPSFPCRAQRLRHHQGWLLPGLQSLREGLSYQGHRPAANIDLARSWTWPQWWWPPGCSSTMPRSAASTVTAAIPTCSPGWRWNAWPRPPALARGASCGAAMGRRPQRIAWLQCVGSRDEEHDYCSAFCCGYATRQAVLARQLLPESEAAIYLMDDRVYARSFSATYDPLRAQYGIAYSRNRPSVIREDPQTHDLILQITDEGGKVSRRALQHGGPLRRRRGSARGGAIGWHPGRDGGRLRIRARRLAWRRSIADRPGIYVAGGATAPADIADSLLQGSAAAARTRAFLGYPAPYRGSARREPGARE